MQAGAAAPQHFNLPHAAPVLGIDRVDGWRLWSHAEWDGDDFAYLEYFARHAELGDRALQVSRFRWSPSQARFAWIVRNDFPPRPNAFGAWDDCDVEEAMAAGSIAA